MKRLLILFITALLLSGCAGRGPFSGAVDGDKMLRVRTINGDAAGNAMPWAEAKAGIDEVRVEETTQPIIGVTIRVNTDKFEVEVRK